MAIPIPQVVIAVAIDCNAFPKGKLRLKDLEDLADVIEEQELDVEVWMPEPVLWELAEHFWDDLVAIRASTKSFHKGASRAGIDTNFPLQLPEFKSVNDVVVDFEERLTEVEGLRTLKLDDYPTVASAAIRDQVLRTRAGKTKPGAEGEPVKTGAADSATFRLVASASGKSIKRVVLVSSDKDAATHFAGSSSPIIMPSIWAAKQGLMALLPGSEIAKVAVAEAVRQHALALTGAELSQVSIEGGHSHFSDAYFDETQYVEAEMFVVAIDNVVSVEDVEVSKSEGYATATAKCSVSLELHAQEWMPFSDDFEFTWDGTRDVEADLQSYLTFKDGEWSLEVEHIVLN